MITLSAEQKKAIHSWWIADARKDTSEEQNKKTQSLILELKLENEGALRLLAISVVGKTLKNNVPRR